MQLGRSALISQISWCHGVSCIFSPTQLAHFRVNKTWWVVLFDAYHWHRAEPVARICHDMRYSVTYKTIANGGNNERLDF